MAQVGEQLMFPAPQFHSSRLGDVIVRSIGKRIFSRKKDEHLHEFIFHAMFWVLSKKWYREEKQKPFGEQHIIVRWEQARYEFLEKVQELGLEINQMTIPTGDVRELLSLAADMYYVQLVNKLPKDLIKRLKTLMDFRVHGMRSQSLPLRFALVLKFNGLNQTVSKKRRNSTHFRALQKKRSP